MIGLGASPALASDPVMQIASLSGPTIADVEGSVPVTENIVLPSVTVRVTADCTAARGTPIYTGSAIFGWAVPQDWVEITGGGKAVSRDQPCEGTTIGTAGSNAGNPDPFVYQNSVDLSFGIQVTLRKTSCPGARICLASTKAKRWRIPVGVNTPTPTPQGVVEVRTYGYVRARSERIVQGTDDFWNVCIKEGRDITSQGGVLGCTTSWPAYARYRVRVLSSRR